jgi:hypothetical protein
LLPSLLPTSLPTLTPTLLDVFVNASHHYGAQGGDTVLIQANNLNDVDTYSCRFLRADDYNVTASFESSEYFMDSPAMILGKDTVQCATPAWGAMFAAARTRLLLIIESGTSIFSHDRVEALGYNYTFYGAWYLIETRGIMQHGARGGDMVNMSLFGVDASADYYLQFSSGSDILSGNCTILQPLVARSTLVCTTPSWGTHFKATNTSVRFIRMAPSSLDVEIIPAAYDIRGLAWDFDFYEVQSGVLSYPNENGPGGLVSGGEVVKLAVYGFDAQSLYFCRFTSISNENFTVDSAYVYPDSPNEMSCITPTWVEVASLTLLEIMKDSNKIQVVKPASLGQEETLFLYEQVLAVANYSTNTTTEVEATGGQSLKFSGLFESNELYRCYVFDEKGNTLYSEGVAPVSMSLLELEVPAWGYHFPAAKVRLRVQIKDDSNDDSLNATLRRKYMRRRLATTDDGDLWYDAGGIELSFKFEAVVLGYDVGVDYGSLGGTMLNITVPGMNQTLGHSCQFVINGSVVNATEVVETSVSSLQCRTPEWGIENCAALSELRVIQDGVTLDTGSGLKSYDFFEALSGVELYPNRANGGGAAGGEEILFSGAGLCVNPLRFSSLYCRFISNLNSSNFMDTNATISSLSEVNCSTPAWGLSFAEDSVHVVLAREDYSNGGVVTALPEANFINYVFDCCIERSLVFVGNTNVPGPARGGQFAYFVVDSWDVPFHFNFETGAALSVGMLLSDSYGYAWSNAANFVAAINVTSFRSENTSAADLTALNNASGGVLSIVTPPGVGAELDVSAIFDELPLLNFLANDSYSYSAPLVTSVTNDATAGTSGVTEGGYNLTVQGVNFGGRDFDPIVYILGTDGVFFTCRSTEWRNDTEVGCIGMPGGTGNLLQTFVEVGGTKGSSSGYFSYEVPSVTSAENLNSDGAQYHPTKGGVIVTITGTNFGSVIEEVEIKIGNNYTCLIGETPVSNPGKGLIYCELQPGTGSDGLRVGVKGLFSQPYPFAYDSPTVSLLTPSSQGDVKGGQQLVVQGTNFGNDARQIRVYLQGAGNFSRECEAVDVLVVHSIVICEYPSYANLVPDGSGGFEQVAIKVGSAKGTGQEIDVVVDVNGQRYRDKDGFAYFDDTGFFSVLAESTLTLRLPPSRAEMFMEYTTNKGMWAGGVHRYENEYLTDEDYIRVLLTDEEQEAISNGLTANVEDSEELGIEVFAKGMLWVTNWGHDKNELVAPINGTVKCWITVKTAFTVDGESNAKKSVNDDLEASLRNHPHLSANATLVGATAFSSGASAGNGRVIFGGDKALYGEVFCGAGKQPQSDGAKRQSCSFCPMNYFKPRLSMWHSGSVSQTAASPLRCGSGDDNDMGAVDCLDRLCLPCPPGGNCNTTGVVIPGRLDGWWRSPEAYDQEDFEKYKFYACLTDQACFSTRPLTANNDLYLLPGKPRNSDCRFDRWYDDNNRRYVFYGDDLWAGDGPWINRGHADGRPLCSVCRKAPPHPAAGDFGYSTAPLGFQEQVFDDDEMQYEALSYYEFSFLCDICPVNTNVTETMYFVGALGVFAFFLTTFAYLGWVSVHLPPFVIRALRSCGLVQSAAAAREQRLSAAVAGEAGVSQNNSSGGGGGGGDVAAKSYASKEQLIDSGKIKIALSFLQVSAVYNVVYDVAWPADFVKLMAYYRVLMDMNLFSLPALSIFGTINLNLAVACEYEVNFYQTFVFSISLPLACVFIFGALGVLGWGYWKLKVGYRGRSLLSLTRVTKKARKAYEAHAEQHVTKCWELFFFMLLVVYPSVSRVSLQILNCKQIDGRRFLSADYNLSCDDEEYGNFE